LQRLPRSKAVLLPGVKVSLVNGKTGETQTWQYDQGLRGYLMEELSHASNGITLIPLFEGEQFATLDNEGFAEGEGASWVVAWTEEGAVVRESYVNLIPTPNGGTHESGLREGLFGAVKSFVELHSVAAKRREITARRRLCARICSSYQPKCSIRNFKAKSKNA